MDKVMPEVAEAVEQARQSGQDSEVRVIVTVSPGTDFSVLERRGLHITRRLDFINAAAGEIPANAVPRLAALPEVVSVEYDGQVKAI